MRKILFLFILVGFVFSSSSWADSGDPVIEGKSITGALGFDTGTTIDEFSTDGTFAGNSDNALPTEKAIKTYGDANWIGDHFIAPGAGTLSTAAAAASDGDVLWLKEGLYTETVPITITSKSLSIIGAGPKVSIIRCTGTHGIVVDTNSTTKHVTLENFTIETTSSGTYIAIQLEGQDVTANVHKQFYVHNIETKSYDVQSDFWQTGIKLIEGWNTTISGCHIEGKSMTLSMDYGIHLTSQSIDVSIINCHFNFLQDGIKVTGSTEGLMISNSVFVYVERGIFASGGILWLGLFNSHINAFLGAVYCSPLNQSKIVGNLIYKREDSNQNFVGIQLSTSGSYNTISSNTIRGVGIGGSEYGIVLGSGLIRNVISGNIIDQQITGIWLQSGANNNIADANITSNCTYEVVDDGTGNSVTDNLAI